MREKEIAEHYKIGNHYLEEGKPDDAIEEYKQAIELEPLFANAWYKSALAYWSKGDEANSAKNANGFTPLQSLMNHSLRLGFKPKLLIDMGFKPWDIDKNGNSLLHHYAKMGNKEYVPFIEELVGFKLDIHLKNKSDITPLMLIFSNFPQSFTNKLILSISDTGLLNLSNESAEQFDEALKHYNENVAVDIFCQANNIVNDSNPNNTLLTRLCTLIKKPVDARFIKKLLDYDEKFYPDYDVLTSRHINVWSISYLIVNWDLIEHSKFNPLNINSLIYCAFDELKSPILSKLLKHLDENITPYSRATA